MKRKIRNKWLEALRSGRYKQGRKFLRNNDCYCCMGVLCDVIDPTKWEAFGRYNGLNSYLSITLLAKIGLNSDQQGFLIHKNDMLGWSFEKIADYIEQEIPSEA